jgi:hypothetical protein
MGMRNYLFGTAFVRATLCIAAVNAQLGKPLDGRPATASDLSGKKLCWDDGLGLFLPPMAISHILAER